jgi:hypothetical protein
MPFAAFDMVLSLSYCVPSTCTANDFEEIFNVYLQNANLPVLAATNEMYCQTNEGKKLGAEDWVTVYDLFISLISSYFRIIILSLI